MLFHSGRSVSNEGFFMSKRQLSTGSTTSDTFRSITRSLSRSSTCGGELKLENVVPEAQFACDFLEHDESLSAVSDGLRSRSVSRKFSRGLENSGDTGEWRQAKRGISAEGLSSRSTSRALSRVNSILTSRPTRANSKVLGKRSLSAGFMFACDHPYDDQDGLSLGGLLECSDTVPNSPTAMEAAGTNREMSDKVADLLGDVDFSFEEAPADLRSGKKRKTAPRQTPVAASNASRDVAVAASADEQADERAALTLNLLEAVARTEEGRTLLGLACNSNKRCRFSFAESIAESIPAELREQVLARITYDPSMKGTANRSEHHLPARDSLPPMIESLVAAGLLPGLAHCTTEVVLHAADGGDRTCRLRLRCELDGAGVEWERQACTACGSCFSRFMYEENKYTEFRRITKDLSAGRRDWSELAGHTLCEPCYRHFTKYGHLNNPRRVPLDALSRILRSAAESSAVPGPQAKTRSRRAGGARRQLVPLKLERS